MMTTFRQRSEGILKLHVVLSESDNDLLYVEMFVQREEALKKIFQYLFGEFNRTKLCCKCPPVI